MKNATRHQIEKNRRKFSIQSMYFNRYLLVRYVTALFFFTNLYWLIALLMSDSSLYFIPSILLIVLLGSVVEHVKIYSNHTNNAKSTRYCYLTLFFTNVLLIITSRFSSTFAQLYPFLLNQEKSQMAILIVLIFGLVLSGLILYRLNKIKYDKDKHYKRIKLYEEVIN